MTRSSTATAVRSRPDHQLSPDEVHRLFGDDYREIEILPDGTVREADGNSEAVDESVTRTLKTKRTWY